MRLGPVCNNGRMSIELDKLLSRAGGLGLGSVAWYAMPDLIRSRGVRTLVKSGLLAGMTASLVATDDGRLGEATSVLLERLSDQVWGTRKAMMASALAVLVTGGVVAATVAGERAIYRRGERRRAAGVRLAHTRQALALGLLGAATAVFEVMDDQVSTTH
jgi:hypothetical protein